VKVFVPWGLCANVAEWHFYHAGNDETSLPDEHWYMAPHFVDRTTYHKEPRYPLRTVNMDATSFSHGPLEDWTAGALRFNGQDQYAVCTHATLQPAPADSDLSDPPKSADVRESNFLVEDWFRTDRDHNGGVIIQKQNASGYALTINDDGGVTFTVKVDGLRKALASHKPVNDGRWHHVIAEADRVDETLSLYVDGTFDAKGSGVDTVSLTNTADLYVGGTPDGDCRQLVSRPGRGRKCR
ncbi:MAG: LamG domain-containing protein, partial [Fuerstiella sp.]|nr:LamG domain-containing protein [Fuerstiella sp.]